MKRLSWSSEPKQKAKEKEAERPDSDEKLLSVNTLIEDGCACWIEAACCGQLNRQRARG